MSNKARANNAKGRNAFLLYDEFASSLADLTDEEAGKLFKHIYAYRAYVKNPDTVPEPPELEDRILRMAFNQVKNRLITDWKNYLETCQKRNSKNKEQEQAEEQDEDSG